MLNLRKLIFHRPLNITTSGLVKISSRNESTSSSSSRSIWDKLLNFPKGFKNYYPKGKGNEKATEGAASKAKNDSFKSKSSSKEGSGPKGSGGGGGGGPDGKPPRIFETILASASITGLGLAYYLFVANSKNGKEISWQEFQSVILETGQVDRLIVSNKKIAKVVIRRPVSTSDEYSSSSSSSLPSSSSSSSSSFNYSTDGSFGNDINNGSMNEENTQADGKLSPSKFIRYPRIGSPTSMETPFYFAIGSVESFERKLEDAQKALGIAPRDFIPVIYANEVDWLKEVAGFAPTFIVIGLYFLFMRGMSGKGGGMGGGPGGLFNFNKSGAKKINKELVTTKFKDVAGCDEAKREIVEFVEFLKDPKKFTDLGAKIPKGALLAGPPGTGKTLLAKATAGEAAVPFFSASGSDFVEMFVGVGASRVRDLFKEARANAPCIIFIDEIDAVGRKRGQGKFGGNDERENTLNQLLVEMDGFDSTANIVILAGTNRADVLDPALLRPGRFDRQIQVEKPDIKGRKAIFEVHLQGITLAQSIDQYSSRLAALTPGFSGADIANICNEAAIVAARRNKKAVDFNDFESATDRVIGGLESKKLISPHEKKVVAYHEAGHAVAGWNLEFADPLLKVTIVPRSSGALGFAQYLPKEVFLRTKEQILDMVCMALAGRAAEQVNFGNYTTGASDDLRRVTQIVYQMVQIYGMNEKIGQLGFSMGENGERMYSESTSELMDTEVRAIVDEAYKRTIALMIEKKEQVRLIAELLIEKETISHMDVSKLIGPRPYSAGKEYEEFLNGSSSETTSTVSEAVDNNTSDSDNSNDSNDINKDSPQPSPIA